MRSVSINEARTHLSRLVDEAARGEEIVIAKAGKPVARLVPLESLAPRRLGSLRGRIRIPGDFDAPLPEDALRMFEGEAPGAESP